LDLVVHFLQHYLLHLLLQNEKLLVLVQDKAQYYHQYYLEMDLLEVYFLLHLVDFLVFLRLLHFLNHLLHHLENHKVHLFHHHHQLM
jgi:hypothetical protein